MKTLALLLALSPLPLSAALVEMWKFNDLPAGPIASGTTTTGVNGALATILGAGANSFLTGGNGIAAVDLPGGSSASAAYIDLPNGIISARTDATFEAWVTQDSVRNWGRVIDFGNTTTGEQFGPGGAGSANDGIWLTFNRGTSPNTQRWEVKDGGYGAVDDSNLVSALGTQHHMVVTWDDMAPNLSLAIWYLDGLPAAAGVYSMNLNDITDVNNWLGRSNWGGDDNADASYDQFAIYDTAWSSAEVMNAFQAGPIPEPSVTLTLSSVLLGGLVFRRRRA
ncbi:MAG: LamG domain-containing protein [Verrucomicrobiales bacterium]|nr:LamG domain-containing protein [Verrucomicrobiales bacterium]